MLIAIVNSPEGEQTSEFDDQPIVLGRHGTLRIPDRRVSKQHARLQRSGAEWYVEDMGSTNGTFVNGTRILRACRVKEGDTLKLGSSVVIISKLSSLGAVQGHEEPGIVPPTVQPVVEPQAERPNGALQHAAPLHAPRLVLQPASGNIEASVPPEAEGTIAPVAPSPAADHAAPAVGDDRDEPETPAANDVTPRAAVPPAEVDERPAITESDDDDLPAFIDAAPATFVYTAPADLVDTAPATFDDAAFGPLVDEQLESVAPLAEIEASHAPAQPADAVEIEPPADAAQSDPALGVAASIIEPTTEPFTTDASAVDLSALDAPALDAPALDTPPLAATALEAPALHAAALDVPRAESPAADLPSSVESAPQPTSAAHTSVSEDGDAPEPHKGGEPPRAPDEDAQDPWMSDLPARRRTQHLRRASDEAILFSIRPLAQRDDDGDGNNDADAGTSRWRRMLPMSILALVLFVVAANLVMLALFRREARRDARELREALDKQDQVAANLIVRELREELRAPSPQSLQAMQDLGDGLLNRQAVLTEKLQAELAAQREAGAKQLATRSKEDAEAAQASQAAMLRELSEIKLAIAGLQKPTAAPPAAATATVQAQARQAAAAAGPDAPPVEAPRPAASVTPVSASPAGSPGVVTDQTAPQRTFLIDASAALEHAIPAAVAEVRRTIETSRRRGGPVRILLLYQGRLIELPAAALDSRDVDPIDRGAADLAAAIKAALADHPPTLYLLSDTLGDLEKTLAAIRAGDTNGTTINVVQFFARERRDQLKALAREYHGEYSYIAPAR